MCWFYWDFAHFAFDDEEGELPWCTWARAVGLSPLGVGWVLGQANAPNPEPLEPGCDEDDAFARALHNAAESEREQVVAALKGGFKGTSGLFMHLWVSNRTVQSWTAEERDRLSDEVPEDADPSSVHFDPRKFMDELMNRAVNEVGGSDFDNKMCAFEWLESADPYYGAGPSPNSSRADVQMDADGPAHRTENADDTGVRRTEPLTGSPEHPGWSQAHDDPRATVSETGAHATSGGRSFGEIVTANPGCFRVILIDAYDETKAVGEMDLTTGEYCIPLLESRSKEIAFNHARQEAGWPDTASASRERVVDSITDRFEVYDDRGRCLGTFPKAPRDRTSASPVVVVDGHACRTVQFSDGLRTVEVWVEDVGWMRAGDGDTPDIGFDRVRSAPRADVQKLRASGLIDVEPRDWPDLPAEFWSMNAK